MNTAFSHCFPRALSLGEHHSGRYWSTVDVIMPSAGLATRLIRCQIHDHDHGSDHRPVVIEFDGQGPPRQHTRTRLLPDKADWHQIGRGIRHKLKTMVLPNEATPAGLDAAAESFLDVVVEVVHNSVPRRDHHHMPRGGGQPNSRCCGARSHQLEIASQHCAGGMSTRRRHEPPSSSSEESTFDISRNRKSCTGKISFKILATSGKPTSSRGWPARQ